MTGRERPRFAIRVHGRGLVTHVNDEALTTLEQAERAAAFISEALGESCIVGPVESVVLYDRIAALPDPVPRP